MTDLYQKNCVPCRGGVLPFDITEIHKYLNIHFQSNGYNKT